MSCWGLRVSGSRGLVRLFLRPSLGLRVSGSSWGLLGVWLVPQGLVVSRSSWGVFSGSRGLNLQLLTISRWTVLLAASGQRGECHPILVLAAPGEFECPFGHPCCPPPLLPLTPRLPSQFTTQFPRVHLGYGAFCLSDPHCMEGEKEERFNIKLRKECVC